jgi:Ca2+-binding RTX toxin-like protein
VLAGEATSGDDIIRGFDRMNPDNWSETINAGKGDDLIIGGSSDDRFIYAAGDGDDRIVASTGNDTLVLTNYNVSDIVSALRASEGSYDLALSFSTSGDRIVITNVLGGYNGGLTGFPISASSSRMARSGPSMRSVHASSRTAIQAAMTPSMAASRTPGKRLRA